MNVWEETWKASFDEVQTPGEGGRFGHLYVGGTYEYDEVACRFGDADIARARLAAAAPDLAQALLAVEWNGHDDFDQCPICGHGHTEDDYDTHDPHCALDAALRKAGVRSHPDAATKREPWRSQHEEALALVTKLRATLRNKVIRPPTRVHAGTCALCCRFWTEDMQEQHSPDCLARPTETG